MQHKEAPALPNNLLRFLLLLLYMKCTTFSSNGKYEFPKDISVEVNWESIICWQLGGAPGE